MQPLLVLQAVHCCLVCQQVLVLVLVLVLVQVQVLVQVLVLPVPVLVVLQMAGSYSMHMRPPLQAPLCCYTSSAMSRLGKVSHLSTHQRLMGVDVGVQGPLTTRLLD